MLTLENCEAAWKEWGMNCGPGALCAVLNMTPEEIRPHLGDFEKKKYTNPTLMFQVLQSIGVKYRVVFKQLGAVTREQASFGIKPPKYPDFGLVRVQWDGRWCDEGVPVAARYRHTHWIGFDKRTDRTGRVFDINAVAYDGGWMSYATWAVHFLDWLLPQIEPKGGGGWWPTHCLEIETEQGLK